MSTNVYAIAHLTIARTSLYLILMLLILVNTHLYNSLYVDLQQVRIVVVDLRTRRSNALEKLYALC